MATSKKTDANEAVLVRMSAELVARVDEARRKSDDLPTRPEMIRRMVADWLDEHE